MRQRGYHLRYLLSICTFLQVFLLNKLNTPYKQLMVAGLGVIVYNFFLPPEDLFALNR